MNEADILVTAARELNESVKRLSFDSPVAYIYNPLDYAAHPYELYLRKYGDSPKQVIFLGMNPGPWGMAQTGIPFGEIEAVKNWLEIDVRVGRPSREHPKRPVLGFRCPRSEVSGKRLWGLFRKRFGTAVKFFHNHFVANYCPLSFIEESGKNRTPDKLKKHERSSLFSFCDEHLRKTVEALSPKWLIGIGRFAGGRAESALKDTSVEVVEILHPSPANPAANRDWEGMACRRLQELKIW